MDKKEHEQDELEKSYIEVLKNVQKSLPNVIFPSMGMLDNEVKLEINNKDFFKESEK